jgi:hypothetical protein
MKRLPGPHRQVKTFATGASAKDLGLTISIDVAGDQPPVRNQAVGWPHDGDCGSGEWWRSLLKYLYFVESARRNLFAMPAQPSLKDPNTLAFTTDCEVPNTTSVIGSP